MADTRNLAERAAKRAKADLQEVATVMAAHGVSAIALPVRARSLQVHRLKIVGTKETHIGPGPFDRSFTFGPGVFVIVAPNLRGKTSILEILTLCLRGSRRELQVDVASWLSDIECDFEINEQAFAIRLKMEAGEIGSAEVYEASDTGALVEEVQRGVPLLKAASATEYSDQIEALMLDRLGLEPLHAALDSDGAGPDFQIHGWPSYFGSIYPASGGNKVLIGETAFAGLAGRLLGVFLDLPRTAVLTRLKTAERNLTRATDSKDTEAREQFIALRHEIESNRLALLRQALSDLPEPATPSATEAAQKVSRISNDLAASERRRLQLSVDFREAVAARQTDTSLLNSAREAAAAARLFHGLEPECCPRCEAVLSKERRRVEIDDGKCSICSSELPEIDDEAAEELIAARESALEASQAAEEAIAAALSAVEADCSNHREQLQSADKDLQDSVQAHLVKERVQLEQQISRAEGALAALDELSQSLPRKTVRDPSQEILRALIRELDDERKESSTYILEELGGAITALASHFGMLEVTKIVPSLDAKLSIQKGGASPSGFGKQSPGERLRLRLALIVALLTVGRRLGIATHPGLLMLDSLKAEEVQDSDAYAILDALIAVSEELPGLQIISTTRDPLLAHGRLSEDRIISAGPDGVLW